MLGRFVMRMNIEKFVRLVAALLYDSYIESGEFVTINYDCLLLCYMCLGIHVQ